jgi:hypothetical protein
MASVVCLPITCGGIRGHQLITSGIRGGQTMQAITEANFDTQRLAAIQNVMAKRSRSPIRHRRGKLDGGIRIIQQVSDDGLILTQECVSKKRSPMPT